MKSAFFYILYFLFSTATFGQIGNQDAGQIVSGSNVGFIRGDHLPDSFLNRNNQTILYKDVQGTAYVDTNQRILFNKTTGQIFNDSLKQVGEFFIRYNAFADQMEVSTLEDGIDYFILKKLPKSWYIKLGKEVYMAFKYRKANVPLTGYFKLIKIEKTPKAGLLGKETITLLKEKKSDNAFISPSPPRFSKMKLTYYIQFENYLELVPNKRKNLHIIFQKHQLTLKEFIKKNKIDPDEKGDLLKMLLYYNSLEAN